jgi:hypothetical protein
MYVSCLLENLLSQEQQMAIDGDLDGNTGRKLLM